MADADARAGRLTADEMLALAGAGLLPERIELVDGRLLAGGETEYVFAPAEARAAASMGIRVRTCVDAVLEDAEALDELRRRTLDTEPGS
ncbi:MAG: hypothetical protein ACXWZY_10825 [Gaiellaceae bacterium]